MKRLNRINYIIYSTLHLLFSLWIIMLIDDLELYYNSFGIIIFLILSFFGYIILIKRGHDYGKDFFSVIVLNIIPGYFIYLAFKKGDIGDNKYGKPDNKILFFKKDNKMRKNIFEVIFYNSILGPLISEEHKDKLLLTKNGRLLATLYPLLYIFLGITIYIVALSLDLIYDEEEVIITLFWIIMLIIPYKFLIPFYLYINNYIKGN